jgi:hypothetical protein
MYIKYHQQQIIYLTKIIANKKINLITTLKHITFTKIKSIIKKIEIDLETNIIK